MFKTQHHVFTKPFITGVLSALIQSTYLFTRKLPFFDNKSTFVSTSSSIPFLITSHVNTPTQFPIHTPNEFPIPIRINPDLDPNLNLLIRFSKPNSFLNPNLISQPPTNFSSQHQRPVDESTKSYDGGL